MNGAPTLFVDGARIDLGFKVGTLAAALTIATAATDERQPGAGGPG